MSEKRSLKFVELTVQEEQQHDHNINNMNMQSNEELEKLNESITNHSAMSQPESIKWVNIRKDKPGGDGLMKSEG